MNLSVNHVNHMQGPRAGQCHFKSILGLIDTFNSETINEGQRSGLATEKQPWRH